MRRLYAAVLAVMVLSIGCDKQPAEVVDGGEKGGEEAASSSGEASRVDYSRIAWSGELPMADPNLLAVMQAAVDNCSFVNGFPDKCEKEAGSVAIKTLEASGHASIPPLVRVMSAGDDQLRDFASWFVQNKFPDAALLAARENPDLLDAPSVLRLRDLVEYGDDALATRVTKLATFTSVIRGEHREMVAVLGNHKNKSVRLIGYKNIMRFGGVDTLDTLQPLAADKSLPRVIRQAVFQAPHELEQWTPEQASTICEWMKVYLTEDDSMIEEWPARAMAKCGGPYVEPLLDEATERLEQLSFGPPFSDSLDELCSPNKPERATPTQCARLYDLLETAAKADRLGERGRVNAAHLLFELRPDETTLDLLEALAKAKDSPAPLAAVAERDAEALAAKIHKGK